MKYEKYVYNRVHWLNKSESLTTPVGKTNLNRMDSAIYNIAENLDIAYNEFSAGKFDKADADKVIVGMPTWDNNTGILTFRFYDGTEFSVDFNIEKIPVSFSMDSAGVITMTTADGTEWTADIGSLIPDYVFEDSDRIAFSETKNADGSYSVSADIKRNSITGDYLQPDYLADVTTQASNAAASAKSASDSADNAAYDAKLSQSYAVGGSGIREGENTDNAKYYSEQSKTSAEQASNIINQNVILQAEKGVANGVASLGNDGKVPRAQLPDASEEVTSVNGQTGDVNITKENIGLGNVGNYKSVSTVASQGLSSTEKSNARANIGAQSSLGFTPVQQGGGSGQLSNKIYIGWSGGQLKAQVDATDMGAIVTTGGNNSSTLPINKGGTGATSAADARNNLGVTPSNIGALSTNGGTINGTVYFGNSRAFSIETTDNYERLLKISSYWSGAGGVELYKYASSLNFQPQSDNYNNLGSSSRRWKNVYCVNSAISTSDRNDKHDISYIGEATNYDTYMSDEQLEQMIMGLKPCVFKRNNGESGRPHHGIISQDFEDLINEIGLSDHAGFIKSPKTRQIEVDTGKLDDAGNPITKTEEEVIEGNYIYGFRYEELVGDIIRFAQLQKMRADSMEKRLKKTEEELSGIKSQVAYFRQYLNS